MRNKIFFILLILKISLGLYEHQVGIHDWHIKNIGEIDSALFNKRKIFFTVKNNKNMYGSVDLISGLSYIFSFNI